MRHYDVVDGGEAQEFLDYLQGRIMRLWAVAGLSLLVGVVLIVATSGPAAMLGGALLVIGGATTLSSVLGQRTIRGARGLVGGPSRRLQMWTYPVSGRGGWTVAVLATFDEVDSVNRTPLAEVKTACFTAGIAERPAAVAEVFGSLEAGRTIVAVDEHGGVVGKAKILRT